MDNTKKAVLVSGASSGIGKQCAMRLDKAGFKVFAGLRNKKEAKELAQIASDQLKPLMLDITDSQSIDSAVHIVSSENLYGLVNNAGIAVLGPLEFIPIQEIRRQFEVNLFGHIAVTQALLPYLRRSGRGRIINMSSLSSFIAFPFFGPYAASKFAFEAFNDSLRRELQPWNIQVVSIRPGNVNTPIWQKSFLTAQDLTDKFPSEAATYYEKSPFKQKSRAAKMSPPSAVAKAVLKALTAKKPKAHYIVGMDARKYAMLKWLLPDRFIDRII